MIYFISSIIFSYIFAKLWNNRYCICMGSNLSTASNFTILIASGRWLYEIIEYISSLKIDSLEFNFIYNIIFFSLLLTAI